MEMLGMYLDPDGENCDQVKYTRTNALTCENSIRFSGILKDESWHALKLTKPLTLKYHLTEMILSRKEYQVITAPILRYGLP